MLGDRFGHRLLILAAALFIDGVRPHLFARTDFDQLNRDSPFILNSSAVRKKATDELSARRFFLDFEEARVLASLFGPDDCFKLEWTLVTLVESALRELQLSLILVA